MEQHRLAELRSLAYHQRIAELLLEDPSVLEQAREVLRGWLEAPNRHPYAEDWAELLDRPPAEIGEALLTDDDAGRTRRQTTPFAKVIDAEERTRIWRELGD